jgi:mannitol 2-dehydrogenase
MLLTFISLAHPGLKEWVLENVSFPNSMVDRITPVSVREDAEFLMQEFQTEDLCPVVSETFFQWVIENNFKNRRPLLEQLGVEYVKDVTPYENMKLRLLNAGHSFLGFLGKRAGYQFIHEAVADTSIFTSLMKFYIEEAVPNIDDFTVSQLNAYVKTLIGRFGNPYIRDHIDRILSGSSAKIPKFLIPTISDQIQKGKTARMGILIIAAWYCYIENLGDPAEINDEMRALLFEKVHNQSSEGHAEFIEIVHVFGDLAKNISFVNQYESALTHLHSQAPPLIRDDATGL